MTENKKADASRAATQQSLLIPELKPCPFCGGQAYERPECDDILAGCQACEATAWKDKWNTRANLVPERESHDRLLEALRDAISDEVARLDSVHLNPERYNLETIDYFNCRVKEWQMIVDRAEKLQEGK